MEPNDGTEPAIAADESFAATEPAAPEPPPEPEPSRHRQIRQALYDRLLESVELDGGADLADPEAARQRIRALIAATLGRDAKRVSTAERRRLEDELLFELRGLGPLGPLFADPTVSDILVNGPRDVWIDRNGQLTRTDVRFDDESHLRRLLERLVASRGRHIDEASPMVDARLEDGSRLHAIIPPLSQAGPLLSIRRFRTRAFTFDELVDGGSLNTQMADFLQAAVRARLNIVVCGGAASGKTTLLNVLSGFIPASERVVTIEETAELRFEHPHTITLESRLPNVEGRGEVSLRTLVKNALRMRADRIVVGEVRGPEVFDMLQAMNVGHDGSLTTVHANSPNDALRRLESLVHMCGLDLPNSAVRELIGMACHLAVQTTRFSDGSRRLASIGEIRLEGSQLHLRELYRFSPQGADGKGRIHGRHEASGERPSFLGRLVESGYRWSSPASRPAAVGGPGGGS